MPALGSPALWSAVYMLAHMRAVIDDEPSAEDEKAAGKRNEMNGIDQIEHAAREREHRKSADAAGPALVGVGEEILKGEPEEEAQAEQERDAGWRRCRDHGMDRIARRIIAAAEL